MIGGGNKISSSLEILNQNKYIYIDILTSKKSKELEEIKNAERNQRN